jgi:hypothetical protein
LLNERLAADEGRMQSWIAEGLSPREIVVQAYLHTLSRTPSDHELNAWLERLDVAQNPQERQARLEDFFWSLLSCQDFLTNH